MADIVLKLSETDRKAIERIATIEAEKIGKAAPASVEEMAAALLSSHLVLINDCGGILPGTGPKPKAVGSKHAGKRVGKVSGKGGVSLSGGR